ncbi:GNAT family N-acetyltransferase [Kineosporia sp. J2-2]|uniref:GNAT family N-acetyltransferase n=1 Tax=Kineosporia corallincola TaxID=2835133 RepID=A0ABS5TDA2_9ACTN|nr:GNAT family N-acetyltransferase [Kineosporia corallincola]MBT0769069.1 GNAT family N-acetyltransferase [Kineosporia corallincola]
MEQTTPVLRPARYPADVDDLAALNIEYLTWATGRLLEEFGVVMAVPDAQASAASVRAFDREGARYLVVENEGVLVGMGALRTLEPGVVEIKRMYLRPELRGLHLGSALLDRLLAEAVDGLGAHTLRLDSCRFMHGAQRLYASRGFTERDPYEGTEIPAQMRENWRFFEKPVPVRA